MTDLGPTHDVLIIGAGPAGASAARVAAGAGLRVALIDKAAFPRDKLCGGGITCRAMGYLTGVFGPLDPALFHTPARIRFADGARTLCDIGDTPAMVMTMRHGFDATLRARAIAAGADDFCGDRITEMDVRDGWVRLASGARLAAPVIIAADGVHSGVARALYGRAHDPARIGFALEAEVPVQGDGTTLLDMTATPFGYAWDFPKAGGRTLGMGGVAIRNADLMPRFRDWLAARGVNPDSLKIKGHHLPFGEVRRRPGDGHVLFAGDAAGLVDPITGEGIAWAVRSGQFAAEAAIAALAAGLPGQAGAKYCARMAPVLAELDRARLLARVVYHPWVQPRFLRAVARSDHFPRRFLGLLAGEMDYADLGPRRLLKVARRMLVG